MDHAELRLPHGYEWGSDERIHGSPEQKRLLMEKTRALIQLTKPGIIIGNTVHVLAGIFFAQVVPGQLSIALAVLIGTTLLIASACIVNNFMDRSIDKAMARTKGRPSVTGEISLLLGGVTATALAILGTVILVLYTNAIVVVIGSIAYISYTLLYGIAKRKTIHSTLIGTIPGALPIAAGYIAITGMVDLLIIGLVLLLVAWQMSHFYAIAIYRRREYAAAHLPIISVKKPFAVVREYIIGYSYIYAVVVITIILLKLVAPTTGLVLLFAAGLWLYSCYGRVGKPEVWARTVFRASLVLPLMVLLAGVFESFSGQL